jgi:hypothetical protein
MKHSLILLVAALTACTHSPSGTAVKRVAIPSAVYAGIAQKAIAKFAAHIDPQNLPDPPPTPGELELTCGGDWLLWWEQDAKGNYVPNSWNVCCGSGCS